jgi:hypothetical protein
VESGAQDDDSYPQIPHMNHQYLFSKNILGPVFAKYCYENWLHLSAFGDEPSVALFCARGGFRLKYLYDNFCEKVEKPTPVQTKNFMISRVSALKVCAYKRPDVVDDFILDEMKDKSIAQILLSLSDKNKEIESLLPSVSFSESRRISDVLKEDTELSKKLVSIFKDQYDLFREYLLDVSDGANNLILCDSGLYGSTQRSLAAALPEMDWFGLYFARANYRSASEDHFSNIVGLISEYNSFHPLKPSSIFLIYWHLIEDTLEPKTASVKGYVRGENGNVKEYPGCDLGSVAPKKEEEPFFAAISDYINELTPESWLMIDRDFNRAIKKLRRMVSFPSSQDVEAMCVGSRTRDLGTTDSVSILRPISSNFKGKIQNIRTSLWREGQCRAEFGMLAPVLLIGLELRTLFKIFKRKIAALGL